MLYRVGKAGPLFPHSQKIQATTYYRGTISGITILYKRDVVNVGAKLAQIERKRNAGSRWIPFNRGGGEGSPANRNSAASRFSLFRRWINSYYQCRAQFTSGSRRPSRQLALLNDTERLARFKSLSPRRCSLNGTCHHVKIQFVPSSWKWKLGEREANEGNDQEGLNTERYPPLCYELNVQGGGNSFQVLVAGWCDGIRFRFPSTVK